MGKLTSRPRPSIRSWALVWALEPRAAPSASTAARTGTSHDRVLDPRRIPVQSIIMAALPCGSVHHRSIRALRNHAASAAPTDNRLQHGARRHGVLVLAEDVRPPART